MSVHVSLSRSPYKLIGLKNDSGMEVLLSPYGARIVAIRTPDRDGNIGDIVLGHSALKNYENPKLDPCFGSTIGRYAGRIANGSFSLDGHEYHLLRNEGGHTLHGGPGGFDRINWYAEKILDGIRFSHTSEDGFNGFPGELDVSVTFRLSNDNELSIHYEATTDRATPVNLTNHAYLNLAGEGSPSISGHLLEIPSDHFLELDDGLIPTGNRLSVDGSPFDFRIAKSVGSEIDAAHPQLKISSGYDHTWVLSEAQERPVVCAAKLFEPRTGRSLEVFTDAPGMHLYTANFLDGSIVGKLGKRYERRSALCLETQMFPNSPNQPSFPNSFVTPDRPFDSQTVFKFGLQG